MSRSIRFKRRTTGVAYWASPAMAARSRVAWRVVSARRVPFRGRGDQRAEPEQVGFSGLVPGSGHGHGADDPGVEPERGGDAGREGDVLTGAGDETLACPALSSSVSSSCRSVIVSGAELLQLAVTVQGVDAHRAEDGPAGGAGVQRQRHAGDEVVADRSGPFMHQGDESRCPLGTLQRDHHGGVAGCRRAGR